MLLATDFNALCTGILFFGLYERMQLIQRTLENNFVPVNIVGQDQLQKNVKIVRKCVSYYSNLLDSFDAVETQLQVMGFSFDVLKLVIENLGSLFLTTSPAIASELISNEIDAIKATLVTQLVRCSDPSLSSELEVALHYIHIRPFKFVICRAVPVNINMPITIISFCITYVIVIMQFIHFSNL
ncbi:uncharacterized protein LOC124641023 [Helicoverpa zea]|uniref:uncharacterized protein LOC124641023 n=1 Tax=Helicoverpa zea TaxID=7113 RepID=UPI001F577739|nr:uncharacterized protein LOC124641023 [Helicoverpa zea]